MKYSLSDMQREKPKEEFVLTVNPEAEDGEKPKSVDVHFVNPKSLHWTKLTALDEMPPMQMLATVIPDDDQFKAFAADPSLDGEALQWVTMQWRNHYGLGQPGE